MLQPNADVILKKILSNKLKIKKTPIIKHHTIPSSKCSLT